MFGFLGRFTAFWALRRWRYGSASLSGMDDELLLDPVRIGQLLDLQGLFLNNIVELLGLTLKHGISSLRRSQLLSHSRHLLL